MSRMSAFNSPLLLGFDHFERVLDRISKTSAEGYPPYNIEQTSENALRITLAVAGFSMDDLSVALEDNQLVIRGRQNEEEDGRIFIHRGIAARQFQRAFVLAEGIEVRGAALDNGLLHVDLKREVPEPRIRTIPIEGAGAARATAKTITVAAEGEGEDTHKSRARTGQKREV
ncbi:heat-shock protein Hsp20 [Paramagnetospirillum kuznetsovii]|uniref:Heat-shock protein Hsp20 n=1 Tax=Paramagnetospirillum kuznetsovii TaxID=2053833 RepID=A0A364P3A0_9PROT|nr:Hsp20 family protein [Paramagnetospirillum kuznetsovii]RAU23647.1 heat-shock protein Hsp20 [Paramagnetospirillum kuznetsovii]